MPRGLLPLATLVFALAAAPAAAQDTDRAAAVDALEEVERLLDGRGVETKRELTPALAALATQTDELGKRDRRTARAILKRPTDPGDENAYAPGADVDTSCSTNFCFHWVNSTTDEDAPSLTDADPANGRSDYVDDLEDAFELSRQVQIGDLDWQPPLPDNRGAPGGHEDKIDVYVANIGDFAFGYAAPEGDARSNPAYLVLDNDYSAEEFQDYGGAHEVPLQVTAAHEFNHVLQYRLDSFQDTWMFEATAMWAEERVFGEHDDYHFYVGPWAERPFEPLTLGNGAREYGSAVWSHWLDAQFGPDVVRRAWELSVLNSVQGGGFAPGAYDAAIREAGGAGFAAEFDDFTASAAEWDAINSQIHEGPEFPRDVARSGALTLNGPPTAGTLDHTAFAVYDVPVSSAPALHLGGALPAGTAGSIALLGFDGATIDKRIAAFDGDGRVSVSLPDPASFERITAVVANADVSHAGFGVDDWLWTKDAQPFRLLASEGAAPVEPDLEPEPTATPTATVTPTVTPAPTATPEPDPPPLLTSVRLSRASQPRLRRIARRGYVRVIARVNQAGRLTGKATVDRRTARRLRIARRAKTVGRGRRTALGEGLVRLNVQLTRETRRALRRHRRTTRIKVRTVFVPADLRALTVRRNVTVRLRR